MQATSSLSISLNSNPALAEALSGKAVGDKIKLQLECSITELSAAAAVFGVEAVVPEGYETAPDEDEEAEPAAPVAMNPDSNIPTGVASLVRKKV